MSFKRKITTKFTDDTGETLSSDVEIVFDQRVDESILIPISTTDTEITIAWVNAGVQFMLLHTTGDLHVKSNDKDEPDDQFDLIKGAPVVFVLGATHGGTNPFTQDVEKLFVTNASGILVPKLSIRIGLNNAPDLEDD